VSGQANGTANEDAPHGRIAGCEDVLTRS